jgi:putative glutathione S-transferase
MKAPELLRDSIFTNIMRGGGPFPPTGGERYMLYATPFAQRCMIVRAMKGLENAIDVVLVEPVYSRTRPEDENDKHEGWLIAPGVDPVFGARTLSDVYDQATPAGHEPSPRFTIPLLIDSKQRLIQTTSHVRSRECSVLSLTPSRSTLRWTCTLPHIDAIDVMNASMQSTLTFGVYRCGFTVSQDVYNT